MNKTLHPKLKEKLNNIHSKYEKVNSFAELLPIFSDEIINGEFTGETYCTLEYNFGKLYCAWGINWYADTPLNYPKEKHHQVGFVGVYINNMSLFNDALYQFSSEKLGEVLPEIQVHFYDQLNSTFYFLPHEAEAGLKRLEQWYIETKALCDDYLKKKRKEELQRELDKLS